MKVKVNGCGAMYCQYNKLGKCTLKEIILGERGECLINKPEISKIEEQRRVENYVMDQRKDAPECDTRRIGFYESETEAPVEEK